MDYFIILSSKAGVLQTATRSSYEFLGNSRVNFGASIGTIVRVPFHQCGNIKLGLLDNLHLTDVAILDGEDARSFTLDLFSSGSGNESLDKGLEVTLSGKGSHGLDHLSSDGTDLGRLSVTGFLELIILLFREGNAEHTDNVSIRGTGINISLNDTLLFLDERAKLITCHVHAVEVKEAVESLDIFDTKLYLTETHGLVVVEVSEGELDDTSSESIGGDLLSLGFCDDGLTAFLLGEDGRGDELEPFFLKEGVDCLFSPFLDLVSLLFFHCDG